MIKERLFLLLEVGKEFQNPKTGSSKIYSISSEKIVFKRGASKIVLPLKYLDEVYNLYKGKNLTTSELHEKYPTVFDSKKGGHSCNATFLFMLYEYLGLTKNGIEGDGVAYHPYYIELLKKDC